MSRLILFFFSSRRRHTRLTCDWSSDVCSSDLALRRTQSGPDTSHGCVAGRLWFESGRWGQGSPAGTKRIPAGGGDPFSLREAKDPRQAGTGHERGTSGSGHGTGQKYRDGIDRDAPGTTSIQTFITKTRRHQQRQNDLLRLNLVPSWLCGEKSAGT